MSEIQDLLDNSDSTLSDAAEVVSSPLEHMRSWSDDAFARVVLLLPGVLVVLLLSIFPLIISLYLTVIRLTFVKGGVQINFVGLSNFAGVLTGSGAEELLGRWGDIPLYGTVAFIAFVLLVLYFLISYIRRPGRTLSGLLFRLAVIVIAAVVLDLLGSW